MAENSYVNKVQKADGTVIMDISGDTATPNDVLNGVTFHDRSGTPQTGAVITHNVYDGLDSTSTSDALSANQGKVLNGKIENPVYTLSITSSAPSTWAGFIALMNKGVGTYYISTSSATRSTLNTAGIIPTTDAGTFVVTYTASNLLTMEYTPYTGSNRYTASYDQNGFKGWEMLALNGKIENKLMTFDSKSGSVSIASANGYGNIELTFTKPANSTVVGDMITLVATTVSANDIVCCVPIEKTDTTVKYRVVSKSAQTVTLTVSRIYRLL